MRRLSEAVFVGASVLCGGCVCRRVCSVHSGVDVRRCAPGRLANILGFCRCAGAAVGVGCVCGGLRVRGNMWRMGGSGEQLCIFVEGAGGITVFIAAAF